MDSLKEFVRQIVCGLQAFEPQRPEDAFTVAIYCRVGRHRSVSWAEMFFEAFSELNVVDVSVEHLHSYGWSRNK